MNQSTGLFDSLVIDVCGTAGRTSGFRDHKVSDALILHNAMARKALPANHSLERFKIRMQVFMGGWCYLMSDTLLRKYS
jgi:hypothetical protein